MTPTYSLAPIDIVSCVGPDAASFLHGQLSQNIEGMAVGDSVESLLLVPDGHLLTTMRVRRLGTDEFRLLVPAGVADAVISRLSRFLLRTDCELERHDGWQMATVIGVTGAALADAFPESAAVVDELRWAGIDGAAVLWAHDAEMPAPLVDAALDPAAVDAARVVAGVAAFGHELETGQIANEAGPGFVERHVDFTKGCYVGQELIARVHHRGSNTPRRVVRLVPTTDGPDDGGSGGVAAGAGVAVGDELATADGAVVTVTTVGDEAALGLAPRKIETGAVVSDPSGVARRVESVG